MLEKAVQQVIAKLERTNEDAKKRIHQTLYSQSNSLEPKINKY